MTLQLFVFPIPYNVIEDTWTPYLFRRLGDKKLRTVQEWVENPLCGLCRNEVFKR